MLDIGMPKITGIEAAKRIRKVAPKTKILFLTQESSSDVVNETFDVGALGYVVKSRAGRELLPAIEEVLTGDRFVSTGLENYEFVETMNA